MNPEIMNRFWYNLEKSLRLSCKYDILEVNGKKGNDENRLRESHNLVIGGCLCNNVGCLVQLVRVIAYAINNGGNSTMLGLRRSWVELTPGL